MSTSMDQERFLGTDFLTQVLVLSKERVTGLQDLIMHPDFSYIWAVPDQLPVNEMPPMSCSHGIITTYFLLQISHDIAT